MFANADGNRLHGWFFPAEDPVGTILHCHGNAGNISAHFGFVSWLPSQRWNVFCFDYRGYGASAGTVTRRGLIDDVAAAHSYLVQREDTINERLCLFGQSLGGAVGLVGAAIHALPLAGICVEGSFSSYRAAARFVTQRTWYLWAGSAVISRLLVSDEWSPKDYVGQLPDMPKLFVCGDNDRIVDCRQTVELFDASDEPKQLLRIAGGEHLGAVENESGDGRSTIVTFFNDCVAATAQVVPPSRQ